MEDLNLPGTENWIVIHIQILMISAQNHLAVVMVEKDLNGRESWKQERNHLFVMSVRNVLQVSQASRGTQDSTQEKKHLLVIFVVKYFHKRL